MGRIVFMVAAIIICAAGLVNQSSAEPWSWGYINGYWGNNYNNPFNANNNRYWNYNNGYWYGQSNAGVYNNSYNNGYNNYSYSPRRGRR